MSEPLARIRFDYDQRIREIFTPFEVGVVFSQLDLVCELLAKEKDKTTRLTAALAALAEKWMLSGRAPRQECATELLRCLEPEKPR